MPGVSSLPADAQHARRRPSAPHADSTSICGFKSAPHSSLAACQLPICRKRRVTLPYADEQHVARKPRESRQRFAVRATGRVRCRITRPQLRSRVSTLVAGRVGDAHVVPHTMYTCEPTHPHTPGPQDPRTRCDAHVVPHTTCSNPLTHTPEPGVTVSGCFGPHMHLVL
jgi:hypothetical protein